MTPLYRLHCILMLWGNFVVIWSSQSDIYTPYTITDPQGELSVLGNFDIKSLELFESIYPSHSRKNRKKSDIIKVKRTMSRLERLLKKRQSGHIDVNYFIREEIRINKEYPCYKPQPRVIDVQKRIPSLIMPTCIVLHRCDDHSGCCPRGGHCKPKKTQHVFRKFGILSGDRIVNMVEQRFQNHTECFCKFNNRAEPTWSKKKQEEFVNNDTDDDDRCRCTEGFVRKYRKGKCRCVCPKELDCQDRWKGKEYFNDSDFRCIDSQKCEPPDCKYGSFIWNKRRCPTIKERFENRA